MKMKTLIAALAVAAAPFVLAPRAGAQVMAEPGPLAPAPEAAAPWTWSYPESSVPPYSYWANYPFPARAYVGYGNNDFPFYGRPYGSPSDPWSWPAMSRTPWVVEHYGALPPW
jgi:hypothetical protein